MFTAAVLRPTSAALLKWIMRGTINLETQGFCLKTRAGDPLPHHMTLNLGPLDSTLNDPAILGQPVTLHVNQLVYDEMICAAPVLMAQWQDLEVKTMNAHPHITVCLKPPAKPMISNELLKKGGLVFQLDGTYELEAVVSLCP